MNDTFQTLILVAEQNPDIPELDLHGLSLQNAQYEIDTFLDKNFREGEKVVKVVMGVGSGVLAEQIPGYIEKFPLTLETYIVRSGFEGGSVVYVVLNE